ncbi:MAG: HAD family phosphatase, partial [Candidatus Bipolaricaulota bacterium]
MTTDLRLLVFDLDGTLLDRDHELPEALRALLRRLRSLGVESTIATGRPLAAVKRFVRSLDLRTPLIA